MCFGWKTFLNLEVLGILKGKLFQASSNKLSKTSWLTVTVSEEGINKWTALNTLIPWLSRSNRASITTKGKTLGSGLSQLTGGRSLFFPINTLKWTKQSLNLVGAEEGKGLVQCMTTLQTKKCFWITVSFRVNSFLLKMAPMIFGLHSVSMATQLQGINGAQLKDLQDCKEHFSKQSDS